MILLYTILLASDYILVITTINKPTSICFASKITLYQNNSNNSDCFKSLIMKFLRSIETFLYICANVYMHISYKYHLKQSI